MEKVDNSRKENVDVVVSEKESSEDNDKRNLELSDFNWTTGSISEAE